MKKHFIIMTLTAALLVAAAGCGKENKPSPNPTVTPVASKKPENTPIPTAKPQDTATPAPTTVPSKAPEVSITVPEDGKKYVDMLGYISTPNMGTTEAYGVKLTKADESSVKDLLKLLAAYETTNNVKCTSITYYAHISAYACEVGTDKFVFVADGRINPNYNMIWRINWDK